MSVSELSPSAQNYLKAVWGLTEWSNAPVTPSLVAERTGLKLSSVSDAIRRLTAQGLLSHARYGSVELTEAGRGYALAMVRRHRLIEAFLVSVLGYSWDQVHDEAEHLEHAVSDFMIDRIDAFLGFPSRDPHGDPIPTADGTVSIPTASQLSELGPGARVVVERISDSDSALLQFFEGHGIVVGAELDVAEGPAFSDAMGVRVVGRPGAVTLGRTATDALYVSLAPA
ncbi:metal-dependent transcriptional regulator [Mycetocola reblochoni]|uniref:Manganese transport regulator n=2 Tax=Mycetocola reblochoni TaxID=331618 RepID=A0A1R4J9U3_9MICO|nr:metal-dependent transcriptional regulator [Mycetocola reblochoni]RLP70083.1 metal-dependent transcriptional regulator [Mycetocola reblochoni]SJN28704.1 Mn-dependent transcriptional regulator MntR [Mycetocola reblochoni REB411]